MLGVVRARSASVARLACAVALSLAAACASSPPPRAEAPRAEAAPAPPPKKVVRVPLSVEGISFESGTEVLRPTAAPALDDLASAIGRSDDGARAMVRVTIDPDPRACEGQTLAGARAEAIRDALVKRGVPAKRVEAEGVAGKRPNCASVSAARSSVVIELLD
jgi:outer membrane protein OmpA-like peptidoglycan-associated protein